MNTDNDKQTISIRGIPIQVIKKNIKNLHVSVLPPTGRVRITSPLKMKDEAIRMAIISRSSWIKKQQIKFQNQKRQSIREYVSGESHYFLGKPYRLKVVETNDKSNISIKGKTQIILEILKGTSLDNRGYQFSKWYRIQLKQVIDKLIIKWEKKMNVKVNKVGIRHMKTRWDHVISKKNQSGLI